MWYLVSAGSSLSVSVEEDNKSYSKRLVGASA